MSHKDNSTILSISKAIIFTHLIIFILSGCAAKKTYSGKTEIIYTSMDIKPSNAENTEYEIIISDPGYDSFLLLQRPVNYYSQKYYENWNRYYVSDWNNKVRSGIYRSPKYADIFNTIINYEPGINYGLEVNYKLYYYFLFVEKKYGVKFDIPRAIKY